MQRSKEIEGKPEHKERCVPLTDDLDMVRLKKLVKDLTPERIGALKDYLEGQDNGRSTS